MLKKAWIDPVWSKVISTAIVAGLASLGAYFYGWWPDIASFFRQTISVATSVTPIKNWLLAILVLCAAVIFVLVGIMLWAIYCPPEVKSSSRSYSEDTVLGIRWRWRYGSDWAIYDLCSFCPHCDYQIQPRNISDFRAIDHVEYRCEDCGAHINDFQMSVGEIESRVKRHIQKKLRSTSITFAAQ